jgi:hypothetical protein
MSAKATIKVDHENNATIWWCAALARPASEIPKSTHRLMHPAFSEVTVTAEDAAAFRAWAEKLPGWSDGPEHARHPFTFHEEPAS